MPKHVNTLRRTRSADAFEAFLAAIRKDITLPPISARVFPYAPD